MQTLLQKRVRLAVQVTARLAGGSSFNGRRPSTADGSARPRGSDLELLPSRQRRQPASAQPSRVGNAPWASVLQPPAAGMEDSALAGRGRVANAAYMHAPALSGEAKAMPRSHREEPELPLLPLNSFAASSECSSGSRGREPYSVRSSWSQGAQVATIDEEEDAAEDEGRAAEGRQEAWPAAWGAAAASARTGAAAPWAAALDLPPHSPHDSSRGSAATQAGVVQTGEPAAVEVDHIWPWQASKSERIALS